MISSYDQPAKTSIARRSTQRRSFTSSSKKYCTPAGILVSDDITYQPEDEGAWLLIKPQPSLKRVSSLQLYLAKSASTGVTTKSLEFFVMKQLVCGDALIRWARMVAKTMESCGER